MKNPPVRRWFAASLLLAVFVWPLRAGSAPAAGERVALPDSLAPLPNVTGAKATSTSQLLASRVTTLSDQQLAAPMEFSVAMGMRNLAEFQARVAGGERVSDAEVQARYLPLQSDFDRVAAWLKGEGFALTFDDTSHLSVFAQGTPAQIQSSFGVTMQSVTIDGEAYTAAATVPSVPASVSTGVQGINGLQPYLHPHTHHRSVPVAKAGGAQPASVSSPNQPPYLVSEIRNAYNGAALTATAPSTTTATTLDGSGQTIGIVIDTFAQHADLIAFWARNGVRAGITTGNIGTVIQEINVAGGATATDQDSELEASLDEEWSSSIAPGAVVRVYCSDDLTSTNLDKCYAQIQQDVRPDTNGVVAQPNLHAVSMSYGGILSGSVSAYATDASYFATIANGNTTTGGVTLFASSGDNGSQPAEPKSARYYVEYPAADLSVTGVGGTDLYYASTTVNGRNWTEKGWGEVTNGSYGGSGGGAAISGFNRPTWQAGATVPSGSTRLVPDVAAAGGPTDADLQFNGSETAVYGTSWSSPTWAGFSALFNQARALDGRLPLGLLTPRVYPLVGTANFYDVTTGNNSYSTTGTGTASYSCATGYDEVTGVGTPNLSALVNTLSGPTITAISPSSVAAGTSVTITGTNFYNSTSLPPAVTFNGAAASSVTVNSASQITAVAPSGVTAGPIVVTSLGDAALAPDLQLAAANPGSVSQGDNGDQFTLTVVNAGSLPTGGTTTVTLVPGPGLYIASVSGTGWTCSAGSGGWTCTRADSLPTSTASVVSSFPALTASVNVSPSASTGAQGGTLTGHVVTSGDNNSANDYSNDTFTISAAASTPVQQWRYAYFNTTANTGSAADTANPSGDGLSNLVKYALNLDPRVPKANPVTEDTSTGYLQLTVPRNPNATDLTYTVQVNGDLTNPTGWAATGTTIVQSTSTLLQVRDTVPVGSVPQRFIRLQVTR